MQQFVSHQKRQKKKGFLRNMHGESILLDTENTAGEAAWICTFQMDWKVKQRFLWLIRLKMAAGNQVCRRRFQHFGFVPYVEFAWISWSVKGAGQVNSEFRVSGRLCVMSLSRSWQRGSSPPNRPGLLGGKWGIYKAPFHLWKLWFTRTFTHCRHSREAANTFTQECIRINTKVICRCSWSLQWRCISQVISGIIMWCDVSLLCQIDASVLCSCTCRLPLPVYCHSQPAACVFPS